MRTSNFAIYPDDKVVYIEDWDTYNLTDVIYVLKLYFDEPGDKFYMKRFEFFDTNNNSTYFEDENFRVIKINKYNYIQSYATDIRYVNPITKKKFYNASIGLTIEHKESEEKFDASLELDPDFGVELFYKTLKAMLKGIQSNWQNLNQSNWGSMLSNMYNIEQERNILWKRGLEYQTELNYKQSEIWKLQDEYRESQKEYRELQKENEKLQKQIDEISRKFNKIKKIVK